MQISKLLFTAIVAVSLHHVAYAGIHRHDVDGQTHLDLANDSAFRAVCRIIKDGAASDSCVLVGSRWVLTAGHTAYLARDRQLSVVFDSRVYSVERQIIHPDFEWGVDFGLDLALLRLNDDVEDVKPVVPYRGDGELGGQATLVGWGVFGAADDPDSALLETGSVRAAGHNIVDSIGGLTPGSPRQQEYLIMDFDSPHDFSLNLTGSARALPLEFAFTGGDSGGGVFLFMNGEYRLAGVISLSEHSTRARATIGRYGSKMYAVRISRVWHWIEEVLTERK